MDGEEVEIEEFKQLHDRGTFEPLFKEKLSKEEKQRALPSLMFLKEKRDGQIKGRTCADRRKQKMDVKKEDAASPTVSIKAVLMSATIDAHKERYMVTTDILGAYLNADMEDDVYMMLEGILAELLVKEAPQVYRKYVSVGKNNKPILYVKLQKALYGCLKSALLFYKVLRKDLEGLGFKVNPYDPCVANKVINGSQLTIVWHVDDLKLLHHEKKEVEKVVSWLEQKYRKLQATRGERHDYLGMYLDFSLKGRVIIDVKDYVRSIVEDFPVKITKMPATPASSQLFKVNKRCKRLSKEEGQQFHTSTAKLLFMQNRGRPDIMTAVAFLTT
eukprot:14158582-Ditylum_brightwellii.AAC.2